MNLLDVSSHHHDWFWWLGKYCVVFKIPCCTMSQLNMWSRLSLKGMLKRVTPRQARVGKGEQGNCECNSLTLLIRPATWTFGDSITNNTYCHWKICIEETRSTTSIQWCWPLIPQVAQCRKNFYFKGVRTIKGVSAIIVSSAMHWQRQVTSLTCDVEDVYQHNLETADLSDHRLCVTLMLNKFFVLLTHTHTNCNGIGVC